MRLVLLGPPGAGKGTQAPAVAEAYGIPHISTGDIFRRNVREGTELGAEARTYMDRGDLVPDAVVIAMVADRLAAADCEPGFLLDGFPRTVPQALALERLLAERACPLDVVLRLELDDEEAVQRLAGRAAAEGRADDAEGVVRRRLAAYHEQTEPLEAFYEERGLLRSVTASGPVGKITRRVLDMLATVRSPDGDAGTGVDAAVGGARA